MNKTYNLKRQGPAGVAFFSLHSTGGLTLILVVLLALMLLGAIYLLVKARQIKRLAKKTDRHFDPESAGEFLSNLDASQVDSYLSSKKLLCWLALGLSSLCSLPAYAQDKSGGASQASLITQPGVIIVIILLLIPVLAAIVFMGVKIVGIARQYRNRDLEEEAEDFDKYLDSLGQKEAEEVLSRRKKALEFSLHHNELSGTESAEDNKGLLQHVSSHGALPVVPVKQRASQRPQIDPKLARLVLWYLGCAAGWLLLGTTIGEYVGIKFVAPDADHISWLSFGRLRPVHTNMVFWGWASLGMLGLGYYIIPRVSNAPLASLRMGWSSLILINVTVLLGSLCLMGGINNGGGEYREYIWPVMLLFAIGLVQTLVNFIRTIAQRTTKEIYISSWYIVSAIMFVLTIAVIAYLPFWQDGLGETIVQGYYMHQGVGMWFMLFTLGIVYYFLPQQLNRPIYSYSLGILAFWTQILFYTFIGTHHFIFSAIPWWLQTVAIVGSMGMVIPVTAGTTNFIMTFRGAWNKVTTSYTLPFFIVGIIFYFTGSMQGTAEAFRTTNLYWHFTDFTVAHSHLTMYGIISFFLWAAMYAVIPRLTGREAPQVTVGAHFWLALVGLLFYTVPLMYGSTLKGVMWTQGKPFMDGVVFMAPYWLWRAIGGSLMWFSHVFFVYNFYRMVVDRQASFTFKPAPAHGIL
jgi:cytochrome c oxidase cbb3-type subunit 1